MTPSEHLQDAKEAVAKETVFKRWENIVDELAGTRDYEEYLERASLLALTNQAEELSKDKTVICPNCEKECQPYSLGQACNHCHYDKL